MRFDPSETDDRKLTLTLLGFAREVARELGEQWQVRSDNDHGYPQALIVCDERGVRFDLSRKSRAKPRLSISGYYGMWESGTNLRHFMPYGEKDPQITVDAERDAKAVAAEIKRRFLPPYFAVIEKCVEAKRRFEEGCRLVERRYKELMELSGGRIHKTEHGSSKGEIALYLRHLDGISLDPRLSTSDSMYFGHGSIDYELFKRILPVILEYHEEKLAAAAARKNRGA